MPSPLGLLIIAIVIIAGSCRLGHYLIKREAWSEIRRPLRGPNHARVTLPCEGEDAQSVILEAVREQNLRLVVTAEGDLASVTLETE